LYIKSHVPSNIAQSDEASIKAEPLISLSGNWKVAII
jgi:hypothetical protein